MKKKQNKGNQSFASTEALAACFSKKLLTSVNHNERICNILYSQKNFYLKILFSLSYQRNKAYVFSIYTKFPLKWHITCIHLLTLDFAHFWGYKVIRTGSMATLYKVLHGYLFLSTMATIDKWAKQNIQYYRIFLYITLKNIERF